MRLKQKELLQLFTSSIENAIQLFSAAQHLLTSYNGEKYPALGLAELALEEIGKSYTCLAYFSKADKMKDWAVFWKEWKNHDLKAHRAFFYEFFCMLRIELDSQIFKNNFPTIRGKFSKEKEKSFYVDIDKSNRQIYIPMNEVSDEECTNRLISIIGLLNATFHIRTWLETKHSEHFKNAISDYAFLTISTQMYTQDVESVLQKMKTENQEYNKGLEAIWELFKPDKSKDKGLDGIINLIKQKKAK